MGQIYYDELSPLLTAACSTQQVAHATKRTYVVSSTVDIVVGSSIGIPWGFDGGGANIVSTITDGSPILRFRIASAGVDCRYLNLRNLSITGNGLDGDAIVLSCPRNDSWLYNFALDGIQITGNGGNGVVLEGSTFEGQIDALYTSNCGQAGLTARNVGPAGNVGIVSDIKLFGGSHRKNPQGGINIPDNDGPNDFKIYGVYFVENGNATPGGKGGLNAAAGVSLIDGCGFENNKGYGVWLQNFGTVRSTSFSTGGNPSIQPIGVTGYISGNLLLDSASAQAYGGGTIALANMSGVSGGKVILLASGNGSNVTVTAPVTKTVLA